IISVPGPLLVIAPEKVSGALISWPAGGALVTVIEPVVPLPTVSVPTPGAMVYLLALSKTRAWTCLLPSRVMVRAAVILPRKLAMADALLGMPPVQLGSVDQLPSLSTFHCGGPEGMTWRRMLVLSGSLMRERA